MKDQNNVAEILAGYFASIADGMKTGKLEISQGQASIHQNLINRYE